MLFLIFIFVKYCGILVSVWDRQTIGHRLEHQWMQLLFSLYFRKSYFRFSFDNICSWCQIDVIIWCQKWWYKKPWGKKICRYLRDLKQQLDIIYKISIGYHVLLGCRNPITNTSRILINLFAGVWRPFFLHRRIWNSLVFFIFLFIRTTRTIVK
jgi:hypothetical protein